MMLLLVIAIGGGAGVFYGLLPVAPAQEQPQNTKQAGPQQKAIDPGIRHTLGPTKQQTTPDADKQKDAPEPSPDVASALNRLPSGSMPRQALVSVQKGQLAVRTLDVAYEPTTVVYEGKAHTNYQKSETLRTRHFNVEIVKAYDVRGKLVDTKDLPKLASREIIALISNDANAADPLNLRLFKDGGTLLFILPPAGPQHSVEAGYPVGPTSGKLPLGPGGFPPIEGPKK
jgi:hypothetical protein